MTYQPQNPFGANPEYDATRHVTQPGMQPTPLPNQPQYGVPMQMQAAPPRKSRNIVKIWVTIGTTLASIGGIVLGGSVIYRNRQEEHLASLVPAADIVTSEYLNALIAGDRNAIEALTTENGDVPGKNERFAGEKGANEASGLTMSFKIIKTEYRDDDGGEATLGAATAATVTVKLKYELVVLEEPVSSWVDWDIMLHRKEVGGDSKSLNHWKVDQAPNSNASGKVGSDFSPPKSKGNCSSPQTIVQEISEAAAEKGSLPAACAAGDGKFNSFEPLVLGFLEKNLVPLKPEDMIDLTGMGSSTDGKTDAPISQIQFSIEDRPFIFTFVLTDISEKDAKDKDRYRLVNIHERKV